MTKLVYDPFRMDYMLYNIYEETHSTMEISEEKNSPPFTHQHFLLTISIGSLDSVWALFPSSSSSSETFICSPSFFLPRKSCKPSWPNESKERRSLLLLLLFIETRTQLWRGLQVSIDVQWHRSRGSFQDGNGANTTFAFIHSLSVCLKVNTRQEKNGEMGKREREKWQKGEDPLCNLMRKCTRLKCLQQVCTIAPSNPQRERKNQPK